MTSQGPLSLDWFINIPHTQHTGSIRQPDGRAIKFYYQRFQLDENITGDSLSDATATCRLYQRAQAHVLVSRSIRSSGQGPGARLKRFRGHRPDWARKEVWHFGHRTFGSGGLESLFSVISLAASNSTAIDNIPRSNIFSGPLSRGRLHSQLDKSGALESS